ncbi:electron transport complex subunit RsxD [Aliidiomarina sedimenti]|uniref:Ion-translocating oxidoreductase complex subunit D n=1 Tax=Aliidiomarina sedimenti TaxID=1933879 RepID=A0ABY0BWX6_9GAMM|nr:electron transport complex subunit RsxD [Aliidiomarina sedimenti]RUO28899.1 electron transport complex subunit RsxD [Aliidiomarina sedimenti]
MSFYIASSPHTRQRRTTARLMQLVIVALIPGILAQWYFFGWGVLLQLLLAITTAYVAESLCLHARERSSLSALRDNTALVTAMLLAVSIPPLAPWWVIVIGVAFSIIVVKHLYGGVGQNLFNPAMAGYVVLLISFPLQMSSWVAPVELTGQHLSLFESIHLMLFQYTSEGYSVEQMRMVASGTGLDAVAMATPLDHIRTDLSQGLTLSESLQAPLFSGLAGLGWQWVNLAYLLGGLFLLQQRVIQWHIPAALLASLALLAALGTLLAPDQLPGIDIHLFSGGTMLAAFFIATDPVSAATSNRGRLVYAALIGLIIYLIRSFGGYPDAIAFAVLLANMCVPIIDKYTRPTTYGHPRRKLQ